MPKLSKLLKLSGKKKGDGDTSSISSKASVQTPAEASAIQIYSYTIAKDKDLPKLHKAVWHGNISKVEGAKSSSVNSQDKQCRTPLHLACARGEVNIVTYLLSYKAQVNTHDVDGRTPLMKAVDSNQCECVRLVLDGGGDANIADNNGLTPLHVAAHRGMMDIATVLLERDAHIDAVDKYGCSPLHYATIQGHNKFVSSLITDGADVNFADGKGQTPLMLAAAEGRIGILKLLLESKPDADLKDTKGCTATDHAIINNNNDCIQLIKDYQGSMVQLSRRVGKPNSMLIDDPKLALSGGNFRGPAIDNIDDFNDSKTEDASMKHDVASHHSWNSNDDDDSSQALSATNRGPSLKNALKLANHQDCGLTQASKGLSSSKDGTVSSQGHPLISKPILHSTTNPQPLKTLQKEKKISQQPAEDFPLDNSFDSDSEDDADHKPTAKVVSSTPNVMDKKLPGLSFSFGKAPLTVALPDDVKDKVIPSDGKSLAVGVTTAAPVTKESKNTTVEKAETLSADKEDTSSNFDSSPPLSDTKDDHFKHFGLDSDDDDVPGVAYVPSVGDVATRQSRKNPLTGHHPQLLTTTEKEKDKILELAQSSFLDLEGTSQKSDSCDEHKTSKGKGAFDTGSLSHNQGTFSPITPLADQANPLFMLAGTQASGTAGECVDPVSPLSGSDSNLDTDSVIRQAEEIEQSAKNPTISDHKVLDKTPSPQDKGDDLHHSEGSNWDSEIGEEMDDSSSNSDSTDGGNNALAGLRSSGLHDPFTSRSKHGSKSTKPASKPADYFNVYDSDSSEGDNNIEKLLSPEKDVVAGTSEPPIKTSTNDSEAFLSAATMPKATASANYHFVGEHVEEHVDSAAAATEDGGVEFLNPLMEHSDNQQTTSEESESEWEKDLKLKRDQKATDQSTTVTPNQQVMHQKQTLPVENEQLSPTTNSSVNTVLSDQTRSVKQDHIAELPVESTSHNNDTKATRSLRDIVLQPDDTQDKQASPSPGKELAFSPSTTQDMEAAKRYQQKQNELLMVLEGRRRQSGNAAEDKATIETTTKSSTRVGEELVHIRRTSVSKLRSSWEGLKQTSTIEPPVLAAPLHQNDTVLKPLKNNPQSLSDIHSLSNDNVSGTTDQQPRESGSSDEESVTETSSGALSQNVSTHAESFIKPTLVSNIDMERLTGAEEHLPLEQSEKSTEVDALVDQSSGVVPGWKAGQVKQLHLLQEEIGKSREDQQLDEVSKPTDPNSNVLTSPQYPSVAVISKPSPTSVTNSQQLKESTQYSTTHKKATISFSEDSSFSSSVPQGHAITSDHPTTLMLRSGRLTSHTDERMSNTEKERHATDIDYADNVTLTGSVSPSSQHTTTELSTTHDVISPVPFLSSSLPQPAMTTSFGRPASSLLESSGVSMLQGSLRKTQRQLEKSQSAEAIAKTGKKRMEAQLKEVYRKQSDLSAARAQLEESKLDLEMANRSMKYQLEQESVARKNAELLVGQLRQQHSKVEQHLREENESHQKALSQKKELELEHRTLLVSTQHLQEGLDDLQARIQQERGSWKLQETLYNERLKVFQDMQEESNKAKERQSQALTQLEESDVIRQSLMEQHSSLQQQLAQAQVQVSREQQQHELVQLQLTAELEATNKRLTAKSNSLIETERALLQLQDQFNSSLTELKSKAEILSAKLDEEAANRRQLDSELSVVRAQLEKANGELHVALREKLELERGQHVKEQDHLRQIGLLERDLASSQGKLQEVVGKVQTAEVKLTSAENEGKTLQSSLFDQANRINAIQREADHSQQLLATTEEKLRRENEVRVKLEGQLTMSNEKLANSQSDLVYLRAQLDVTNKKITDKDVHTSETQDKFTSIIENLKVDHQQARNSLEERLQSLRDQLMAAKEEVNMHNLEKNSLDKEIGRLKQELGRCSQEKQTLEKTVLQSKELSTSDRASQLDLQQKIQVLSSKLAASESSLISSQQSCKDLHEQLVQQQQHCDELQEKLALAMQECSTTNEDKLQLETSVTLLTGELKQSQNELNTKDERIVDFSTQLKHLQDVRSGLEQTTTLLRGEIHELETQLTGMTVERDKALISAEEFKGLWETEIKSRSQLGLKLMQLQKSHSDHAVVLENEKKKCRRAIEMKKNVEQKIESYKERNTLLQEESVSLKCQQKSLKKRLKEIEVSDSTLRVELDKTQQLLQAETDSLNGQLLKVSTELRTESLLRKEADNGVAALKRECERSRSQLSLSKAELRDKEKVHRQLDKANKRLREELNSLKEEVLSNYTPTSEVEAYKLQVEEKAKQELRAKLEEVNTHLEHQSTVQEALDKLRSDTELHWQSRYEQTTEELKFQLKKALSEVEELRVQRDSKDAEARRYKELFEVESLRREKLSNKFEMARERGTDHFSEQRPPYLLDDSLSTSLSRNLHSMPASSFPQPSTNSVPLKNSTNDLLSSVRQELDRSIAKHLDSVSRPQLKYRHPSQSAPKRDARVTAIAQNYFV